MPGDSSAELHHQQPTSRLSEFRRSCQGVPDKTNAKLLELFVAEIEDLRRRQEEMIEKQEGADSTRRGQLNCMSERIFQAERHLRQAQEQQSDAIEKASATFQKQASDVEQERQNLSSVINQVNQNFEHISSEMSQHGLTLGAVEQNIVRLQDAVSQHTIDTRKTMLDFGHDMAVLERKVQQQQQQRQQGSELLLLEQTVQAQQQQLRDLFTDVQAMHEAVAGFTEAELRQRPLAERLRELEDFVSDSQLQQKALFGQLSEIRHQVSDLAELVGRAMARPDLSQETEWLPLTTRALLSERQRAETLQLPTQPLPQPQPQPQPQQQLSAGSAQVSAELQTGDAASVPSFLSRRDVSPRRDVASGESRPLGSGFRTGSGSGCGSVSGLTADSVAYRGEDGTHPRSGVWRDLPPLRSFQPLSSGEPGESASLLDMEAVRAASNSLVFDLPQAGARAARTAERSRVPERAASPPSITGWRGGCMTSEVGL